MYTIKAMNPNVEGSGVTEHLRHYVSALVVAEAYVNAGYVVNCNGVVMQRDETGHINAIDMRDIVV